MTSEQYQEYLKSEEWQVVGTEKARSGPFKCVGCDSVRLRFLQLHHMIYPADIWATEPKHCCWLCDRCHETFHRAPAKYIAMATTEQITRMVIEAQKNEEDGFVGMASWAKSSPFLKKLGL